MDAQRLAGVERVLMQNDQPLGPREWEWRQQDGVHEREDRRVGTDADGERQNRDRCEPGTLAQRAQRVGHVLTNAVDRGETSRVSAFLLPQRDRAQLAKRLISRVRRRHAVRHVVIDLVLQMVLELLIELALYSAPLNEGADS